MLDVFHPKLLAKRKYWNRWLKQFYWHDQQRQFFKKLRLENINPIYYAAVDSMRNSSLSYGPGNPGNLYPSRGASPGLKFDRNRHYSPCDDSRDLPVSAAKGNHIRYDFSILSRSPVRTRPTKWLDEDSSSLDPVKQF